MEDSHARSLCKGISWRITGTLDTIFVAFFITGHIGNAVTIGVTEVITKILLYYGHERLWNIIRWGRTQKGPTNARSLTKGITWRVVGTIDTIFLSYLITGQTVNAFKIGGTELITKVLLYYLHERLWALIKWGRVYKDSEKEEVLEKQSVS
ncbi:MAG TPA: DUF2061 domain-containing protein [Cytophagaceae bacterium]